ncbi:bifunctional class I SAM-dependent methyltransferase/N-acetyltransferase [Actinomadura sp. CNU-125]|uniref:bifunctional class I SAM-dependent methyltransferase/N-acetyltransferase n=1 Tax=Actinomadura sp. CNU-125 TaxID=1904961 RepID=UPI000AAEE2A9|nr:bifunctional class I SAM-dependent methyltransferase/N-acetyltransferase [Actinomadura sp. CNU-125]
MSQTVIEALLALHHGLPRQGPGSDATTRRLLSLAGPGPGAPRALDAGSGPGRAALVLAAEANARVDAVDLYRPFLLELLDAAERQGVHDRVRAMCCSMDRLPFPDQVFDLVWSESAVYNIGLDAALRGWRRLLAPDGVVVVTEIEWAADEPSPQARAWWEPVYPVRTAEENAAIVRAAGYEVVARLPLPETDWWEEYYTPLEERIGAADLSRPGMAEAVAGTREEIALRRAHGEDYRYTGYVLRPVDRPATAWTTRTETPADVDVIREIVRTAFPTAEESALVDALRADTAAWIPGLSVVAGAPDGRVAGHALFTRCHVGDEPAAGARAGRGGARRPAAGRRGGRDPGGLDAARAMGENLVVVLGHPEYYPRFGFERASAYGIRAAFDAPDDALMALGLDASRPVPGGVIRYAAPFGV